MRKNIRSTKTSSTVLASEEPNVEQLKGKKVRDVYAKVYNVRETILSDQLLRGNTYVMVLVEIDSNAIMVAPMKSRHGGKMKHAYQ